MPSVVRAASATTAHSGCADGERVTGSPSRPSMSQTCGIARSVVRGSTRAPPTTTPSAGPSSLYASQISDDREDADEAPAPAGELATATPGPTRRAGGAGQPAPAASVTAAVSRMSRSVMPWP